MTLKNRDKYDIIYNILGLVQEPKPGSIFRNQLSGEYSSSMIKRYVTYMRERDLLLMANDVYYITPRGAKYRKIYEKMMAGLKLPKDFD